MVVVEVVVRAVVRMKELREVAAVILKGLLVGRGVVVVEVEVMGAAVVDLKRINRLRNQSLEAYYEAQLTSLFCREHFGQNHKNPPLD